MTEPSSPATKDDLIELERRFNRNMDASLSEFENRMDAKLESLETRIMGCFELLTENLVAEFRGAANDKFSVHDDQILDCRKRLTRLEHQAGIGGV